MSLKTVLMLPIFSTSYGMPCAVSVTWNSSVIWRFSSLRHSEKKVSVGSPTLHASTFISRNTT